MTLGDLIYGNVTPAWTDLAGNITTTKKFLTQTGTGAVSAVPAWDTIIDGDIPAAITRDTEVPGLETNAAVDTEAELEAITGALFGASKVVTAGYIWVADGTDFESVPMTGDVSIATGGATAVGDDSHAHTSTTLPATTSYLGSAIESAEITDATIVAADVAIISA